MDAILTTILGMLGATAVVLVGLATKSYLYLLGALKASQDKNNELTEENIRYKGLLIKVVLSGQGLILTDNDLDRDEHLEKIKIFQEVSKEILSEITRKKEEKKD
jgi:hypothetical protein